MYEIPVAMGAAWLDDNKPGWYKLLDLSELDMYDPHNCILGQLYADEYNADQRYVNSGYDHAKYNLMDDSSDVFTFGFSLIEVGYSSEWRNLRDAWLIEINKRLAES